MNENVNEIRISMPVRDGNIETPYGWASGIHRELDSFFSRLNRAIYYDCGMSRKIMTTRKLGECNGVISVIVTATWEGPEWTHPAAEAFINTFIQRNEIEVN